MRLPSGENPPPDPDKAAAAERVAAAKGAVRSRERELVEPRRHSPQPWRG